PLFLANSFLARSVFFGVKSFFPWRLCPFRASPPLSPPAFFDQCYPCSSAVRVLPAFSPIPRVCPGSPPPALRSADPPIAGWGTVAAIRQCARRIACNGKETP